MTSDNAALRVRTPHQHPRLAMRFMSLPAIWRVARGFAGRCTDTPRGFSSSPYHTIPRAERAEMSVHQSAHTYLLNSCVVAPCSGALQVDQPCTELDPDLM